MNERKIDLDNKAERIDKYHKKRDELYCPYKFSPVFSLDDRSPELHEFMMAAFGGA